PRQLVLYVEDEEANRKVAQLRLREKCNLLCAESSRAACEILTTRGSTIDVVLMDIQLKGSDLNGVQLVKLIRGKLEPSSIPVYARKVPVLDIPLIFVTAYGSIHAEQDLIAAGGDQVMHKPVDFVKLAGALARFHAREVLRTR
ncbi:MAG: response regulator, partial [Usitatibacter sp.]